MLRSLIVALALALLPATASATFFLTQDCQPAYLPLCLDDLDTYDDEFVFAQCKAEVDLAVEEWRSYINCLSLKASEAGTRLDEAQRQWVCRAEHFGFSDARVREFGKGDHPLGKYFLRNDIVCDGIRPVQD
jgi:hypothetical protein